MIVKENYMGKIGFSENYIRSLCGMVLCESIGVSGLVPAGRRSLLRFLTCQEDYSKHADRAVTLKVIDGKLIIGVHITVIYGSQISAVTESVVGKIKWVVEERTAVPVSKITVYIDGMTD